MKEIDQILTVLFGPQEDTIWLAKMWCDLLQWACIRGRKNKIKNKECYMLCLLLRLYCEHVSMLLSIFQNCHISSVKNILWLFTHLILLSLVYV